jgi:hypothetical protein
MSELTDATQFFKAVETWLKDQGYKPQEDGDLASPAGLLWSVQVRVHHACHTIGHCQVMSVTQTLSHWRNLPGWTEEDAREALVASGINPAEYNL